MTSVCRLLFKILFNLRRKLAAGNRLIADNFIIFLAIGMLDCVMIDRCDLNISRKVYYVAISAVSAGSQ